MNNKSLWIFPNLDLQGFEGSGKFCLLRRWEWDLTYVRCLIWSGVRPLDCGLDELCYYSRPELVNLQSSAADPHWKLLSLPAHKSDLMVDSGQSQHLAVWIRMSGWRHAFVLYLPNVLWCSVCVIAYYSYGPQIWHTVSADIWPKHKTIFFLTGWEKNIQTNGSNVVRNKSYYFISVK